MRDVTLYYATMEVKLLWLDKKDIKEVDQLYNITSD